MADVSNFDRQMALIQILDPDASIKYSNYTEKWYVSARIEIKTGGILSNVTRHGDNPQAALNLYLCEFTNKNVVIVTDAYLSTRREWVWNRIAESWAPYRGY